jgi:hypothetical protein
VIGVPLLKGDNEVRLDLQQLFETVWARSPYEQLVDYASDPIPGLPANDAKWVDTLLKKRGLRS